MLIKLYKIIDSHVYKRYKTPNRPNIICSTYNCSEGISYKGESKICYGCSIANDPVEELYNNDSWDSKFCYVCYDNKKSSNNKR